VELLPFEENQQRMYHLIPMVCQGYPHEEGRWNGIIIRPRLIERAADVYTNALSICQDCCAAMILPGTPTLSSAGSAVVQKPSAVGQYSGVHVCTSLYEPWTEYYAIAPPLFMWTPLADLLLPCPCCPFRTSPQPGLILNAILKLLNSDTVPAYTLIAEFKLRLVPGFIFSTSQEVQQQEHTEAEFASALTVEARSFVTSLSYR